MPRIEIHPRHPTYKYPGQELPGYQKGRITGVIGDFADEDGVYELPNGDSLTIKMNPAEATASGLQFIALTSLLFVGHERKPTAGKVVNYFGKKRRLVAIGKEGFGSIQLSSAEDLKVTLKSSLQGK